MKAIYDLKKSKFKLKGLLLVLLLLLFSALQVKAQTIASTTASPLILCEGGTLNLTGNLTYSPVVTTGTDITWVWVASTGGETFSTTTQASGGLANDIVYPVIPTYIGSRTFGLTVSFGSTSLTASTGLVTLNAKPTAAISGTATICSSTSTNLRVDISTGAFPMNIEYSNGSPGGTFTSTATSSPHFISVSPTNNTVYTLTGITDNNGCTAISSGLSGTATITVTQVPTITASSGDARCGTGMVTLTATPSAGTVKWYAASSGGTELATGNTYTPTVTETTNYFVDATYLDCTTSGRTTVTATVNTIPTITSAVPNSRCGPGQISLSATASTGATVQWWSAQTGGTLLASGNTYSPTISGTTWYYVDALLGSCTSTATRTSVQATMNSVPSVTGTTPGSICAPGGPVTLSATPSSGGNTIHWWNASSGGTELTTGNTYTPTVTETTTFYVDATSSFSCTTATRTAVTATVKTLPTITATSGDTRCGSGMVTLTATPSAGIVNWYISATATSTVATGNTYTPTVTETTTFYVDATADGCTTGTRTPVIATVNLVPTASVLSLGTGLATICSGNASSIKVTITGGTATCTVVYSNGVSNTTVTNYTSGADISVSPATTTTYSLVSVTTSAGCAGTGNSGTATVTVNPSPIAAFIASPQPLCIGTPLTLTATQSLVDGMRYNWTGPAGVNLTVEYPTYWVTIGEVTNGHTGTYTLTVTNIATGCTGIYNRYVTVNPLPTVNVSGGGTVCAGTSSTVTFDFTGTAPWNLTYTAGAATLTLTTSTDPLVLTLTPSITTTYSPTALTDANCVALAAGLTGSATITVNPIPTITSTTPGSRCGSGTVTLGATASEGTVNWYTSATATTTVATGNSYTTPSISVTTNYYVDATSLGCTTAGRTTVTATVNTIPSITGTTDGSRCGSGTVTLGATASAGTVNWYTSATATSTVATGNSYTTPSISSTTTYYVDATSGSCTTATRTAVTATINPIPSITGTTPASICGPGSVTLGATASVGTVNWYTSATATATVATGNSYTTPSISTTTTYYVDATSGSCTTATRTTVVATVKTIPTILTTTPGSRCGTGSVTLGATASAGTVNWYTSGTATSTVATGISYTTLSISVTTTYYVDATADGCTTGTRTPVIATINTPATITPSSDSRIVCQNTLLTPMVYTVGGSATSATITVGSLPAGVTGSFSGSSFTISGTPTVFGTFTFTVSTVGGSCPATATGTITVNPAPSAIVTGADNVCIGLTTPLTATGTWYSALWVSLNPAIATISADGIVLGVSAGTTTITLTLTSEFSCTTTYYFPMRVDGPASLTLSSGSGTNIQTRCINTAISNITYIVGGGATNAVTGGLPAGVTGSYNAGVYTISGTPTQSGIFTYTVTTTGGACTPAATATGTITVTALPTMSRTSGSATTVVCQNAAITPVVYTFGGGATSASVTGAFPTGVSFAVVGSTLTISGTATGSPAVYSYTVITSGGCSPAATATGTITVNALPSITPSSATRTVCQNAPMTSLLYTIGGSATSATITVGSLPTGVTGVFSAGSFTISGTPTVSGTFNFTIGTTGGSCGSATATGTITVTPVPVITATSNSAVCEGGVLILTGSSTAPGSNYAWTGPAGFAVSGPNTVITFSPMAHANEGTYWLTVTATGYCSTQTSTVVVMAPATVAGTVTSTQTTICYNTQPTANLNLTGFTGSVVKWQKSSDAAFTSPVDIAVTTPYLLGSTIGQLTSSTYFRAVVQSGTCAALNSGSLLITVSPLVPVPTVIPTEPTCAVATGSLQITAPTGTGMTYSIGGTYTSTTLFSGLTAGGTYTVTARNADGCVSNGYVYTFGPQPWTPPTPTVSVTQQPTCSVPTGTIVISAPTATGMTYSIDGITYVNTTGVFVLVAPGTYTATAKSMAGCISNGASVTVNPQPAPPTVFTVTGGGSYCQNGTGVAIGLSGSQTGVNYTLKLGAATITTIAGTGTATTFGLQTAAGTYSVTATNATTLCTSNMNGSATIVINPLPATPTVIATSSACTGSTGTFAVVVPLMSENFTSNVMPPAGWSLDGGFNSHWSTSSTAYAGGVAPEAHFSYAPSGIGTSRLISPQVNTTGNTTIYLTFKTMYDIYGPPVPTIGVATRSGSGAWHTVWETNVGMAAQTVSVPISNSDVGAADLQIAFFIDGDFWYMNDWYLDNIILSTTPGSSTGVTYAWSVTGTGNTITGSGTTATVTWNPAFSGVATVGVSATNACGTTATSTTNVTVTSAPVAPVTPVGALYNCPGTTATYSTSAVTGASSYNWSVTGTGNQIVQNGLSAVVTWGTGFSGTATVTVTASNACGTSAPASLGVTVFTIPAATATSNSPVCEGGTLELTAGPVGNYLYVWNGPNGFYLQTEQPVVTISPVTLSSSGNYTLSVLNIGGTGYYCAGTTSTTVTINPVPTTPTISVVSTCGNAVLTAHNYTGTLLWSTGATTASITVSASGTYSVNQTVGSCTSEAGTVSVTIAPCGGTIAGYMNYDNDYLTGMNGVTINLTTPSGIPVASTLTTFDNAGEMGYYSFTGVAAGTYSVTAAFNGTWLGNNATDALIVNLSTIGAWPLTGLNAIVADVNNDGKITGVDALQIKDRTSGVIDHYAAGNWKFTSAAVTIVSTETVNANLLALCTGDVNGSDMPGSLKNAALLTAIDGELMTVPVNQTFTYDIKSSVVAKLGAMTLFMNYDANLFTIDKVNSSVDGMSYKIEDGRIAIAWSNTNPLKVKMDETVISLKMTVKEALTEPVQIFTINDGSEFADPLANKITNFELKMSKVITAESNLEFSMVNYPNPFKSFTEIVYTIPVDGKVRLVLTNMFGQQIRTLVDAQQAAGIYKVKVNSVDANMEPGLYLYSIEVEGTTTRFTKTNKMLFTR